MEGSAGESLIELLMGSRSVGKLAVHLGCRVVQY